MRQFPQFGRMSELGPGVECCWAALVAWWHAGTRTETVAVGGRLVARSLTKCGRDCRCTYAHYLFTNYLQLFGDEQAKEIDACENCDGRFRCVEPRLTGQTLWMASPLLGTTDPSRSARANLTTRETKV
jgi:hypothetical protein